MKVCGLIVEYNPFHNGHIKHIKEAKKLTKADLIIAVTSGNFTQRGEVSIIDKFEKTKAALNNGVDLVIELPYIYTVQNGSEFAKKAVEILNDLKVSDIVFGSETNNLEELKKMSSFNIKVDNLKEKMKTGMSYPKAYGLLTDSLYPNDMLAVSYLKAISKTNITAHSIKRTTNYNNTKLNKIASAKAIRYAIKFNKNYRIATPMCINNPHFTEELYPILRHTLLTRNKSELNKIFLVNEGIENLLIKNAVKYDNYKDFINNSISYRYTNSRINRVCLHILTNVTKADYKKASKDKYIRVLGFNKKGQKYLKTLKNSDINILTQFKNINENSKDIEWKASILYSSLVKKPSLYLIKELKGPIIKK